MLQAAIELCPPDMLLGYVADDGSHNWALDGQVTRCWPPTLPPYVFIYHVDAQAPCPLITDPAFWKAVLETRRITVYIVAVKEGKLGKEVIFSEPDSFSSILFPCNGTIVIKEARGVFCNANAWIPLLNQQQFIAVGYPDMKQFYATVLARYSCVLIDGLHAISGDGVLSTPNLRFLLLARKLSLGMQAVAVPNNVTVSDLMMVQAVSWRRHTRVHEWKTAVEILYPVFRQHGAHAGMGDNVIVVVHDDILCEFLATPSGPVLPISELAIHAFDSKRYKTALNALQASRHRFPNLVSVWRAMGVPGPLSKQSPVVSRTALRMRLAQAPQLFTGRFFGRTDTKNTPSFKPNAAKLALCLAHNLFGRRAKFYGLLYLRRAMHADPAVRRTAGWLGLHSQDVIGLIVQFVLGGTSAQYAQRDGPYPQLSMRAVQERLKADQRSVRHYRVQLEKRRQIARDFANRIRNRKRQMANNDKPAGPETTKEFWDWLASERAAAINKLRAVCGKRVRDDEPEEEGGDKRARKEEDGAALC